MTFNLGLFFAVVLGLSMGRFIFGHTFTNRAAGVSTECCGEITPTKLVSAAADGASEAEMLHQIPLDAK